MDIVTILSFLLIIVSLLGMVLSNILLIRFSLLVCFGGFVFVLYRTLLEKEN